MPGEDNNAMERSLDLASTWVNDAKIILYFSLSEYMKMNGCNLSVYHYSGCNCAKIPRPMVLYKASLRDIKNWSL